jgi:hypothetical protein
MLINNYNDYLNTIRTSIFGIHFQTLSLYIALMGDHSTTSRQDLLSRWASKEYTNLSDESKTEYHTRDYIDGLDKNIAAVAALLHHGLELSFFFASGDV